MRFFSFGICIAALTAATILGDPTRLHLYIGAGCVWAAAVALLPRLPRTRADRWLVVAFAVAMRVPGWLAAPVHSDDIHRYLWDGRVQRAGVNPYLYQPDGPELAGLRDESWSHVNNKELPTIYPPLAQLLFRAAPSAAVWKALVALADLGLVLLLLLKLEDPRRAIVWAWCPLAAVELSLEGHVDGIAILLLMGALFSRPKWLAGALIAASAAVKLLAAPVLLAVRDRRAIGAFALVLLLAAAPFLGAGSKLPGSLGEYARRWRGNDGAFAVLYTLSEKAVAHSEYRGRVERKDSRWLRFMTGRDRDTIFPDEAANFFARVAAGILWLFAICVALFLRLPPVKLAEVTFGAFLLLTPALHPWYVLWVVPLVAVGGSPAWLVLAALVPLGYEPLGRWLAGAPWQDPMWTRLLEHGLTFCVLLLGLIPRQRPLLSSDR
jgi:hypothetical protein